MSVIKGTDKSETLTDTGVNSTIYGFGGDDTIHGLAGNDALDGGNGNDKLYGEAGDDFLYGGYGSNLFDGGQGNDTASFEDVSFTKLTLALDGSFQSSANIAGDVFVSIESIIGISGGANILAGNGAANQLEGFGYADKLYGRGGDDNLGGGLGADRLDGGPGIDLAFYRSNGVTVSLDGSLTATGEAAGDILVSIENLEGTDGWNDILAGNSVANTIWGDGGNDTIYGRGGNDDLLGGLGNDKIYGEAGDDWLYGGNGRDLLSGGDGKDGASYFSSLGVKVSLDNSIAATGEAWGDTFDSIENLTGSGTGADTLAGNAESNRIFGYGGNDVVYGRAGNDTLFGQDGNDSLAGQQGDDWLVGGAGQDRLNGGAGNDGASYYDSAGVTASLDGSLQAAGEAVGDVFISIEMLEGSNRGNDVLAGDANGNQLYGQDGNNVLYGRAGDDYINAGAGNDKLYGEAGDDSLESDAGNDYFNGGAGVDYVEYLDASAVTASLDGSLVARGAATGDTYVSIENLAGSDTGNDILAGNAGKNELWGGGGNDTLYGRAGDDRLYGNAGADTLYGEAGNDIFAFKFPDDGTDQIMDFAAGDKIGIRTDQFAGFTPGSLAAEQFQSGADHTATTDTVRFLYDQTDNSLWYDADGNGAAAAVELALLKNGYVLSASDFILLPAG